MLTDPKEIEQFKRMMRSLRASSKNCFLIMWCFFVLVIVFGIISAVAFYGATSSVPISFLPLVLILIYASLNKKEISGSNKRENEKIISKMEEIWLEKNG